MNTPPGKWVGDGHKILNGAEKRGQHPEHNLDTISPHDILFTVRAPICTQHNQPMRKLTLSDYQALAEFRYQIRRFLHFSEQAIQAAGMERGQYQLMLAIKGMPAGIRPRIRELANRMEIRHHSAVELVNRLEAGGFVHRTRAEDDRREVLLALTPKGEKVLAELALHHHEELRSAGPELVAALRRVMREGIDAIGKYSRPEEKRRN